MPPAVTVAAAVAAPPATFGDQANVPPPLAILAVSVTVGFAHVTVAGAAMETTGAVVFCSTVTDLILEQLLPEFVAVTV